MHEDEKWLNREDPDSDGTPLTQNVSGSLSSATLLKEIRSDRDCETYKEASANLISGIIGFLFFSFLGLSLAVYAILDLVNDPTTILENSIFIAMSSIVLLLAGGGIYIYRVNSLYTSRKGIGHTHHRFTDCAIQWEHISHIAIDEMKDDIYMMWIYGNKRKIIFQNPWWSQKRFTYSSLKSYLPDLDNWVISHKKESQRNLVRYRRNL